jgi:hypothetical protein
MVGLKGASWLVVTVEEATRSPVLVDFVKTSSEGRKSLTVKRGCNKAGRFLKVVPFMDDELKGIIWIPKARFGRGWRRFVAELRPLLTAMGSLSKGSMLEGSAPEGSHQRNKSERTYVEALYSSSDEVAVSVEPQRLLSQELDILLMENKYELRINGMDVRSI